MFGVMQLVTCTGEPAPRVLSDATIKRIMTSRSKDDILRKAAKQLNLKKIKSLFDKKDYSYYCIIDAMSCTKNDKVIELLASHINKKIMKKIKEIEAKKLIWKYVFNWLTKPITKDGKLGIDARLGLKQFDELDKAPLFLEKNN